MKFAFYTLGCKLNFAESSSLSRELISSGATRAALGEQADVCVVNTCSVTDAADRKGRQLIHRVRRENKNAILIVTGCYAALKRNEISSMPEVDYVLGMDDKFSLPSFVHQLSVGGSLGSTTRSQTEGLFHGAVSYDDRTRCFVKVQDGCDYFCTYCTIPFARGRSRNDSIENTVVTINQALQAGAKEIVLTGVNIGDFGKTTNEKFIDLLRAIDALNGDFRVRISSCEPNLLSDEIIDFVASSNHFAPHFHIPLQSGSDEMLRIMHRRYDTALFRERVEHIKRVIPQAFIGVDCMVGVRGEKEEYFENYLHFVESLPVSELHVFTYSERERTRMVSMDLSSVPSKERKRRSEVLHLLSERKLKEFYDSQRGRKAIVLWESKREGNMMSGFTENYIRVSCPYQKEKINTFEQITI